nr:hypothetical protein SEVIR_2G285300v2 [Setaria viridis]
MSSHRERLCPYNYIYGRFYCQECGGECRPGPGQHRITSLAHRKFLRYINDICHCKSETRMRFAVLVFKKRADGERAVDEVNGYEVAGHKLRVDWVYPSCV